jgi:uncharacterized membrane protein (UPF0182 family)
MKRKIKIYISIFCILIIAGLYIQFQTMEFQEAGGYSQIFYISFIYKAIITCSLSGIIFGLIYLGGKRLEKNLKLKKESEQKLVRNLTIVGSIVIIFEMLFHNKSDLYKKAMMFMNAESFGIQDPMHNWDISYYIFKMDFIHSTINTLLVISIIVTLYILFIYLTVFEFQRQKKRNKSTYILKNKIISKKMKSMSMKKMHIQDLNLKGIKSVAIKKCETKNRKNENLSNIDWDLIKKTPRFIINSLSLNYRNFMNFEIGKDVFIAMNMVFLLLAAKYYFLRDKIIFFNELDWAGVGEFTFHFWNIGYSVLAIFTFIICGMIFYQIKQKNLKKGLGLATLHLFLPLSVIGLYFFGSQMNGSTLNREMQYNIEYTRQAYQLEDMWINFNEELTDEEKESMYASLSASNNEQIIENKEFEGKEYLSYEKDEMEAFDQKEIVVDLEENKKKEKGEEKSHLVKKSELENFLPQEGMYRNPEIIPIGYSSKENKKVFFISPRESMLSLEKLSYNNVEKEHTHGYGVDVFDVLGKKTDILEKKIKRNQIYYGSAMDNLVAVNTSIKEADNFGNNYHEYVGEGGIKLNFLNRLISYLKYNNADILFSDELSNNSRLLINRNIIRRAEKILPFVHIGKDIGITISTDGHIKWVLNGYTTTDKYPFSQSTKLDGKKITYIRKAVKIFVDAYDGKMEILKVDREDPIIQAYEKIFPGVIQEAKIENEFLEEIVYPKELLRIQFEVLKDYNFDNKTIEEFKAKSNSIIEKSDKQILEDNLYYCITKEQKERFFIVIPIKYGFNENNEKHKFYVIVKKGDGFIGGILNLDKGV